MTHRGQASASRRAVLATGALGLLASAVRASGQRPATLSVPEVDSLAIQVVTDAATFGPFLPSLDLPGLSVTFAGGGPPHAPRMLPHALLGEFGLALHAVSTRGAETRRVMIDLGYSREVLANNLALLGIDPARLDAAVLSHGHLDHYGGFAGLFGADGGKRHRLPLTVGGEETFCERVAMIGDPPPVMGALDRAALARAGLRVRVAPGPALLADHGFTTGLIPLDSFERAAIPTRMRPGVGCSRALLDPAKRDVAELPDDGAHELATAYHVKGLGLVVIASCSHRGVINSVRQAQCVSGVDRVHAVIGGFHLVRPRTEDEARRTVAEFATIDPAYVAPMHCTGETFIQEAIRVMPRKIVRPYVGATLSFPGRA